MADTLRFGSETYRAGALERIEEARLLLRAERLVLAVYVAGLAVEGMLRALYWRKDKRFDERHNLKALAMRVAQLGLLRGKRDDDFVAAVETVAERWDNALRYAGTAQLKRFLVQRGTIRKTRLNQMKLVCGDFVDDCLKIVNRCEVLCER